MISAWELWQVPETMSSKGSAGILACSTLQSACYDETSRSANVCRQGCLRSQVPVFWTWSLKVKLNRQLQLSRRINRAR